MYQKDDQVKVSAIYVRFCCSFSHKTIFHCLSQLNLHLSYRLSNRIASNWFLSRRMKAEDWIQMHNSFRKFWIFFVSLSLTSSWENETFLCNFFFGAEFNNQSNYGRARFFLRYLRDSTKYRSTICYNFNFLNQSDQIQLQWSLLAFASSWIKLDSSDGIFSF